MFALLSLLACTEPADVDPGPDYVGTWEVDRFTRGCQFPEEIDFGASHVRIDLGVDLGVEFIQVFACSSRTECDTFFSAYTLDVEDDQNASSLEEGFSIFEGACDLNWVEITLEMDGDNVVIRQSTEGNAEDVFASSAGECGVRIEAYEGARECLRSEELVLTPLPEEASE